MKEGERNIIPRLKEKYIKEIRPILMKKLNYKNIMEVPRVEKIVINIGVGEGGTDPKAIEACMNDLSLITGQHPVITKAKRSISNFNIKKGMPIGCKVTLRRDRMFEFLDRFVNIALPRVRDFTGTPLSVFDGKGNLTIGIKEQIIFPEIDYEKVYKIRGMDITIVTTAKTDEEARELLSSLGMPFQKVKTKESSVAN